MTEQLLSSRSGSVWNQWPNAKKCVSQLQSFKISNSGLISLIWSFYLEAWSLQISVPWVTNSLGNSKDGSARLCQWAVLSLSALLIRNPAFLASILSIYPWKKKKTSCLEKSNANFDFFCLLFQYLSLISGDVSEWKHILTAALIISLFSLTVFF